MRERAREPPGWAHNLVRVHRDDLFGRVHVFLHRLMKAAAKNDSPDGPQTKSHFGRKWRSDERDGRGSYPHWRTVRPMKNGKSRWVCQPSNPDMCASGPFSEGAGPVTIEIDSSAD